MELIKPNKKFFKSYVEAINEYKDNKISTYKFLDPDSYDIFEYTDRLEKGTNLAKGEAPATYLWMVSGNCFLGEVCIHHVLTESLLHFDGNIKYGIRYPKWYEGIGTEMLKLALIYAKNYLYLNTALLTCSDNNHGSYRVIEKNGGLLQNKIVSIIDGQKKILRRYWISIE